MTSTAAEAAAEKFPKAPGYGQTFNRTRRTQQAAFLAGVAWAAQVARDYSERDEKLARRDAVALGRYSAGRQIADLLVGGPE